MAATKRQASKVPGARKRGRYKRGKKAAPDATPIVGEPATFIQVSRETWLEWVEDWAAGSPVEHEGTKRALAEAMADARRVVDELGSLPSHMLTDGQSRLLLRALREVRELAKSLATDRLKKKRSAPAWTPTQEVSDARAIDPGTGEVARGEVPNEGRSPVVDAGPGVGGAGAVPARPRLADLVPRASP